MQVSYRIRLRGLRHPAHLVVKLRTVDRPRLFDDSSETSLPQKHLFDFTLWISMNKAHCTP